MGRFNMEKSKPTPTLRPTSLWLSDRDSPSIEEERKLNGKIPHTLVVGSIMYAIVAIRPNLAFAIGVINRYMWNPRRKHSEVFKHIFRHLRGTKDVQLTFGSATPTEVKGYTNSDYVGNMDNQKSLSDCNFTYGGDAISWRSTLQECMALSTTEGKYMVASS